MNLPHRVRRLVVLVVFALGGHLLASAEKHPEPLLLLVSLDAFRWDYCDLYPAETLTLRELKRTGVSARGLIPAFPSNTFPNHYSIVTGLYPSSHGIINNDFFDAASGSFFHYKIASTVAESRWWGGEPIWVTAEKAGARAATAFWTGSEAAIQGVRPSFWRAFDPRMTFAQRFEEFQQWLALPEHERPRVIAFYFEETNSIGHRFGPSAPELAQTIRQLDAQLQQLLDAIKAAQLEVNLVVVSDHGMTSISRDRIIVLDDFLSPADVQVDFDGPVAGLRPLNTDVARLLQALSGLQHARAYRVEDLPAHFRIAPTPRTPPVWIVPDEGWEIYFRSRLAAWGDRFNRGDHGYDPTLESMHGILIAHGPAFHADGRMIDAVENVHVYNLLCATLGLSRASNDGDDRLVRALLKK